MDTRNKPQKNEQQQDAAKPAVQNPFDNSQPVEKDIEQSREELDKEQQFKEAQTERD